MTKKLDRKYATEVSETDRELANEVISIAGLPGLEVYRLELLAAWISRLRTREYQRGRKQALSRAKDAFRVRDLGEDACYIPD